MTGTAVLTLVALEKPITDRSQIRLSRNPRGAALVRCDRCDVRRSEHAVYRVSLGRHVCRPCLDHVELVGQELHPAKPARRFPPSNGLVFPPASSALRLRQVFDPIADYNLWHAIVPRRPLPVTSQAGPVPVGWAA